MKDIRIREYKGEYCGEKQDRDLNASINILIEGIEKITKERLNII